MPFAVKHAPAALKICTFDDWKSLSFATNEKKSFPRFDVPDHRAAALGKCDDQKSKSLHGPAYQ
jgi:hypothetical protein